MVDVLLFGPHPDDIEICAGGLALKMVAAGYSVGGVDLTAGESGTRGDVEQRRAEAEEGARRLGLAFRECLGMPDGGIRDNAESCDLIIAAIRRHRPRLVVAPIPIDHHPDHARAGALVKQARFLAGCSKLGPGGEAYRPGRTLFYPSREPVPPSLVVDVSAHWDAKLHAIRAHVSQLHDASSDGPLTTISKGDFLLRIEADARHYGAQIGAAYGEAFVVDGPLAIDDPLPVVRDGPQSVFL